MCARYTITRHQQHIYYTRCRTGPDCNVGPQTQHKGWAQMHSPLLLVRPLLLVFSKGWASILFKFQHGKQRFYGRTSNKKALLDAFSLQAHLRMKRFPLRNNFFKKKKLVETLLARDPS